MLVESAICRTMGQPRLVTSGSSLHLSLSVCGVGVNVSLEPAGVAMKLALLIRTGLADVYTSAGVMSMDLTV